MLENLFWEMKKLLQLFENRSLCKLTFTSSKSTIDTLEKGVKYVQS